VSCAATICTPARFSHVSVQTWQRFVSLPSLALSYSFRSIRMR